MNTHNNNHESTTQVGNPYLVDGSIPPPPPPEWSMHQRTGKAWKIVLSALIAVSILLTSTFIYIIRFESGITAHNSTYNTISVGKATTPQYTPTLPPTPTKVSSANKGSGLYAQDFKSFYGAFTQDITSGKFDLLGSSVVDTSSFQLACDNSTSPPCTYAWISVDNMLNGRHLIFSSASGGPGPSSYDVIYINDSCKNIPYPVRAYTYTMVHYDQDGSLNAPMVGDAVLAFVDTAINSNTNQWIWEEVILQGSC